MCELPASDKEKDENACLCYGSYVCISVYDYCSTYLLVWDPILLSLLSPPLFRNAMGEFVDIEVSQAKERERRKAPFHEQNSRLTRLCAKHLWKKKKKVFFSDAKQMSFLAFPLLKRLCVSRRLRISKKRRKNYYSHIPFFRERKKNVGESRKLKFFLCKEVFFLSRKRFPLPPNPTLFPLTCVTPRGRVVRERGKEREGRRSLSSYLLHTRTSKMKMGKKEEDDNMSFFLSHSQDASLLFLFLPCS